MQVFAGSRSLAFRVLQRRGRLLCSRSVRAQEKRRLWDEPGGFPVQWKSGRHGEHVTFRARRVQFNRTFPNLHMRFLRCCGSLCGYFQSNPAARIAAPGNQNLPAYRQDSQNLPGHKQPDSCLCADALWEMSAVPGSQKKACLQFIKTFARENDLPLCSLGKTERVRPDWISAYPSVRLFVVAAH